MKTNSAPQTHTQLAAAWPARPGLQQALFASRGRFAAKIASAPRGVTCRALRPGTPEGAGASADAAARHTHASGQPNIVPLHDTATALRKSLAALREELAMYSGQRGAAGPAAAPQSPAPPARRPAAHPPSWPTAAARHGLYSDVPVDRVDGLHTRVIGKLPDWLKGSMYRNGPGMFEGAHAVFDGCAMLVRFKLDGPTNSAVLSHRFLESTYYKAAKGQGSIKWRMAHPPEAQRSVLQGLAYAGGIALGTLQYGRHLGDNAVVSIMPQGNELIAHTETLSGTFRIHPETLETLGRVHYRDDVHGLIKTAHQQRLPNGDYIGVVADFSPPLDRATAQLMLPEITVYRQSPWRCDWREKVAAVPYLRPTHPTWIHEIPVTEKYAVVVQSPVFYNVRALLMGQTADFMAFDWRPEHGTLIHVVPLLGGQVKTYHAPAFLASHWVNGFESPDGRHLHLDAIVARTPELMSQWELARVRAGPEGGKQVEPSRLCRLTLDLAQPDGSFLGQEPLLRPLAPDAAYGHGMELPTVNPNNRCRPYSFAYAACCVRPTNAYNALCKVDTRTGHVQIWHEPGGATWEPIFVPRPGAKEEDDGVVVSAIMQPDGRSALLVLDARSWQEVARAVVPYALPSGFHGCFVPS